MSLICINPILTNASSFATGRGSPYYFQCQPTSTLYHLVRRPLSLILGTRDIHSYPQAHYFIPRLFSLPLLCDLSIAAVWFSFGGTAIVVFRIKFLQLLPLHPTLASGYKLLTLYRLHKYTQANRAYCFMVARIHLVLRARIVSLYPSVRALTSTARVGNLKRLTRLAMVPGDRLELPTRRASTYRSTNWAIQA